MSMKSKVCNRCGVEKVLEEFYRRKKGKDDRRARCKACLSSRDKKYYSTNREEVLERTKEYRAANRDKIAAKDKKYYAVNAEKIKAHKKEYRVANAKKNTEYQKKYYSANREELIEYQKEYQAENAGKIAEYHKEYRKKRYAEDPEFRTMISLRNQTKRLGDYKSKTTIEIVGISAEEFWRRNGSPTAEQLEDLHIDHIVPLSWFDLTNEDHVRVSSHWTNFQYLSEEDNLIKNNNYAGRPDAILGYKEDFDIQKHVKDMIQFLNETNNF